MATQNVRRPLVSVEQLTHHYGARRAKPVIDNVSLTLHEGEIVGLLGRSGSGKSPLLRSLAGLWPDGEGQVALADRTTAMFVPQRLYLPLGTLKAAICFPDAADVHDDAAILALLDAVHLGPLADDLPAERMWQEELSPGEQQRVALARILLQRPALLILDEATSALDYESERIIQKNMFEIVKGRTVIVIAHRLQAVRPCHRIVGMDDGRIVEIGTHDELLKRGGLYARLWALQNDLERV
jgi:putative ATP-binding cassette transporter